MLYAGSIQEKTGSHWILTVFGAEATAADAPAMAGMKALCLTNSCTVALPYTWTLESVALGLTSPCLSHHCSHLCTNHPRNISRYDTSQMNFYTIYHVI
ncbi:defensin j1-2 [Nicotiana attenuata]|uniref:Defensin j1-2 n=1 Tax=Nicotiana attenuata TaxID=49451 RepID=A0A1J6I1K9_NICAT|nr:defensin j1-2 [Nicotiana attenuata]